jgi:hypothetical protein
MLKPDPLHHFDLTREEYEILVTLQVAKARLFLEGCEPSVRPRLNAWLDAWVGLLFDGGMVRFRGPPDAAGVDRALRGLTAIPAFKRHIVGFEVFLFEPFFSVGKRAHEGLGSLVKTHRQIADSARAAMVRRMIDAGLDSEVISRIELDFADGVRRFRPSRLFERVAVGAAIAVVLAATGGVAAPAIGAAIGGVMGLSGAAATAAGLAFLGGGSLAGGGLGVLGGTVAVVGGGALLGAVVGSTLVAFSTSPKLLVRELAKLYVILTRFLPLLDAPERSHVIDQVMIGSRRLRDSLEDQLHHARQAGENREDHQCSGVRESLESIVKFRAWLGGF